MALNVTASVTKTNVSKDEVIQLKVVADEKLDGSKVSFDALSDEFFMGRPSFSSSVNISTALVVTAVYGPLLSRPSV